jgi:nucleoside-diphosphate kinase
MTPAVMEGARIDHDVEPWAVVERGSWLRHRPSLARPVAAPFCRRDQVLRFPGEISGWWHPGRDASRKPNLNERTLVLVKPDGVQRGLIGEILGRFERKGLRVVALKLLRMDMEMAGRLYAEHAQKPFFHDVAAFITSGPLVAMVLEAPGVVAAVRQMMGATDPADSAPGTIRGDFGLTVGMNVVHGSDSIGRAEEEIAFFFTAKDVLDYRRDLERWILGA